MKMNGSNQTGDRKDYLGMNKYIGGRIEEIMASMDMSVNDLASTLHQQMGVQENTVKTG